MKGNDGSNGSCDKNDVDSIDDSSGIGDTCGNGDDNGE